MLLGDDRDGFGSCEHMGRVASGRERVGARNVTAIGIWAAQ